MLCVGSTVLHWRMFVYGYFEISSRPLSLTGESLILCAVLTALQVNIINVCPSNAASCFVDSHDASVTAPG